jgi:hypothetical protein
MKYCGEMYFDYNKDLGVSDAQCALSMLKIGARLDKQAKDLSILRQKALAKNADDKFLSMYFDAYSEYILNRSFEQAVLTQFVSHQRPTKPATKKTPVKTESKVAKPVAK